MQLVYSERKSEHKTIFFEILQVPLIKVYLKHEFAVEKWYQLVVSNLFGKSFSKWTFFAIYNWWEKRLECK